MKKRIVCLILIFLLTACNVKVSLNTEAGQITDAAAAIADFNPPAGYNPEFYIRLEGYTLVSFSSKESAGHLYLIQSENPADAEELEQAFKRLNPRDRDSELRMKVIDSRSVLVNEHEATLVLSEGENGDGKIYRQASLAFAGQNGPALLIFSRPANLWSEAELDALIGSLH